MAGVTNCHCHRPAMLLTSWTDLNPGHRFYECSTARPHGCGYFMWYDPPMQQRAIQVIPGLLRRLRALENECNKLRGRERSYLIIIGVSLILGIWKLFGSITDSQDSPDVDI